MEAREEPMNYLESVITRLKKHVNRILPAGAVTAVLGASLIVGTTGIIGLGTGYSYGGPNCLSANITAGPAYPQLPGTMVTLTATATNCTHPEFQFYVQVPGGLWTAKTSFLPWGQNTYSWDTTGLSAGNYGVGVWARHSGSAGSYEAYYIGTYQLAVSNCQTASLTASPAAPQSPATNITF